MSHATGPPHIPRERSSYIAADGVARQLERQLDLTVVVTLVPEQELEPEKGEAARLYSPP